MKHDFRPLLFATGTLATIAFSPVPVLATQGHGGIEGVYAHQIAHLFFLFSMGSLIYWLRARQLVREPGWRLIQFSALFFILWNLDTITVHALDDQFEIIQVQSLDLWHIQISDTFDSSRMRLLYYLVKLDHLFCVPALLFLYAGLKRLLQENKPAASGGARA